MKTNSYKYLEEKDVRAMFPPYVPPSGKGEYFIDFVTHSPEIYHIKLDETRWFDLWCFAIIKLILRFKIA